MPPFLAISASGLHYPRNTYPGYPGPVARTKGDLPGGLEGLEELIWLEKGAQNKGIEQTESDKEEEGGEGGRGHD